MIYVYDVILEELKSLESIEDVITQWLTRYWYEVSVW